MRGRDLRRRALSRLMGFVCALAVLICLVPLAFILFFVVSKGVSSLNLDFFTQLPKPVGESGGGMANAIVGTVILIGLGSVMAVPIGILSGVAECTWRSTQAVVLPPSSALPLTP